MSASRGTHRRKSLGLASDQTYMSLSDIVRTHTCKDSESKRVDSRGCSEVPVRPVSLRLSQYSWIVPPQH